MPTTKPPLTKECNALMQSLEEARKSFEHYRYVVIRSLLDESLAAFLHEYACGRAAAGQLDISDQQVAGTPAAYGDPMMERLLDKLHPEIEYACGLRLAPTYSYYRVYKPGDRLQQHCDRPACEISVSLNLGQEPDRPWALWIEGREGAYPAELAPGDAVMYRGVECDHWREPFEGARLAQVFLHYVDCSGPCAEWEFDKRPGLNC